MTVLRPSVPRLALVVGLTSALGLGLTGLGGGAVAQTAATTVPSATGTTTPPEVPATGTRTHRYAPRHKGRGMAGYLASLHDQLKITAAEEPLWTTFTDTMEANSRALGEAYRQRRSQLPSMNAVADMNSFIALEQMRVEGLKKSAAAFTALYQVMPPDQQKIADTIFLSDMPGGPHRRKKPPPHP